MNIAIIGATGLLGQALIPRLLDASHEVLALSPRPDKAETLYGKRVRTAHVDLLDPEVDQALEPVLADYDTVVNIATAIPRDFSAPNAWDANTEIRIEGTRRVLKAVLNARVPNYVQQSITLSYPDLGDEWITEETPLETNPELAWLWQPVQLMEAQLHAIDPARLKWSILRGGSFIGKDTFQMVTLDLLKQGAQKIARTGNAYSSYVRVEDMAEAVKLAIEVAPAGVTLNINDDPVLEADYLKQLADYMGAPQPEVDPDLPEPRSQRVSPQKAHEVLGWQATHSLMPDFLAV